MTKSFTTALRASAVALIVGFAASPAALAAESFSFDKGHSEVNFTYNHVGLSNQSGRFDDFDGTIELDFDDPTQSAVDVTIKAASIDTDVEALDQHLSSGDFFDVANHPDITFKSTEVKQTGADTYNVTGDLTIKGITKPVTLEAKLNHHGDHPLAPYMPAYAGAPYAAFSINGTILRSDFGLGQFAPLTSDTVQLNIETELRQVVATQ